MTRIGRIVSTVLGNPAPVLFLDSCTLLDVVRAPLRIKPVEVRVAGQFLTATRKTPKSLHLLIASPTPTEWNDHIDEAEKDCATAVRAYDTVASVCGHLGFGGVAFLPSLAPNLPVQLRQLSADLLGAADRIDHNAAALGRAADRIIAATHPAKPGGKGAKDSIILEHVIETTASRRQAGFTAACVFVSSRTRGTSRRPGPSTCCRRSPRLFTRFSYNTPRAWSTPRRSCSRRAGCPESKPCPLPGRLYPCSEPSPAT